MSRYFSDRTQSSRRHLAMRVRAVSEAWDAGDEEALRTELRELAKDAALLAKAVPLPGVLRDFD